MSSDDSAFFAGVTVGASIVFLVGLVVVNIHDYNRTKLLLDKGVAKYELVSPGSDKTQLVYHSCAVTEQTAKDNKGVGK